MPMLDLLSGFAALSLLSGAMIALLPEGSLRRTASMVIGLLMLMYWYGSLQSMGDLLPLFLPGTAQAPVTPLQGTGVTLPALAEAAP